MSFIIENDIIISFAEYDDVVQRDKRVFDSNEGLSDDVVETALIRATERILSGMRSSQWWKSYWLSRSNTSITTSADIPALDPDNIKARQSDFTELAVYWAMAEYILPQVANFGEESDDDRNKMNWYATKKSELFAELIEAGDWYDFDEDGTVQSSEKQPGIYALKRYR